MPITNYSCSDKFRIDKSKGINCSLNFSRNVPYLIDFFNGSSQISPNLTYKNGNYFKLTLLNKYLYLLSLSN